MTTTTARARRPEHARAAGSAGTARAAGSAGTARAAASGMTARAAASAVTAPIGERRRPTLRLVEVRRDGSRRSAAGIAGWLLTAVLFASVFSVVICQALLAQAQSRLDGVNQNIARETALSKQQRSDIAALESPHRIVDEAVERLGMVASPDVAYLQPDAADDQRAALPPESAAPATTVPPPAATAPTTTAGEAVASAPGRTPAVSSGGTARSGTGRPATTRAPVTTTAKVTAKAPAASSRAATGTTTKAPTTGAGR
jgi:hypothetical protein